MQSLSPFNVNRFASLFDHLSLQDEEGDIEPSKGAPIMKTAEADVEASTHSKSIEEPVLSAAAAPEKRDHQLGRIKRIANAHKDDIHGIILFGNSMITGSKDGSLKQWELDGKLRHVVYNPGKIDYRNWVTAITPLDETCWLSAHRSGELYSWNAKGRWTKLISPEQPDHHSKARNSLRPNCLTAFKGPEGTSLFFTGWATQFTTHLLPEGNILEETKTSDNDWVYAIERVTDSSLLVVSGPTLDLFEKKAADLKWTKSQTLIKENRKSKIRPFISAVTKLTGEVSAYGVAVFDGSVQVIDIQTGQICFRGQEHQNRVWEIENIERSCFASCADDGLIKLWDPRRSVKSSFTIRDDEKYKARVSVICNLGNNQLVSASCPDDVFGLTESASLSFWDIRKI